MVEPGQRQLFAAVRLTGAGQFRPHGAVLLRQVDRLHQVHRVMGAAASLLARVVNQRRQQNRLQTVNVILIHQAAVQLCQSINKQPATRRCTRRRSGITSAGRCLYVRI